MSISIIGIENLLLKATIISSDEEIVVTRMRCIPSHLAKLVVNLCNDMVQFSKHCLLSFGDDPCLRGEM